MKADELLAAMRENKCNVSGICAQGAWQWTYSDNGDHTSVTRAVATLKKRGLVTCTYYRGGKGDASLTEAGELEADEILADRDGVDVETLRKRVQQAVAVTAAEQRDYFTDEESERLRTVVLDYCDDLAMLASKYIRRFPMEVRSMVEARLQESTNLYSAYTANAIDAYLAAVTADANDIVWDFEGDRVVCNRQQFLRIQECVRSAGGGAFVAAVNEVRAIFGLRLRPALNFVKHLIDQRLLEVR